MTRLPRITLALGERDTSNRAYAFQLQEGTLDIDIDIKVRPIPSVVIQSPHKTGAVAKGGHSRVVVNPKGVSVAAISGRAMIGIVGSRWRPLAVGRALIVDAEKGAPSTTELLPPPVPVSTSRLGVFLGNATDSGHRIEWKAIAGAESYSLQVGEQNTDGIRTVWSRSGQQSPCTIPTLPPGQYRAWVSAENSFGLSTRSVEPLDIRVVGLVLPKRAVIDGRTVRIPAQHMLPLSNTAGLLMTYGASGDVFFPAPSQVGPIEDEPLVVRLRDPDSGNESSFRVEPLVTVARIELRPARAIWPSDTVKARITLPGTDTLLLGELGLVPRVTVNAQPVDTQWQERKPGTIFASIPPPFTPGPWVVRVTLHDEQGHELAGDFLEVAEKSTPTRVVRQP